MPSPALLPLTPVELTRAFSRLKEAWVAEGLAASMEQAHCGAAPGGNCFTLARQVTANLEEEGFDVEALMFVDLASYQVENEDDEDGRPLDKRLLKKHWPQVVPPAPMTWELLKGLADDGGWCSSTHAWLVLNGRHYDAECPEGVENFLALPFFTRSIRGWLEEKHPSLLTVAPVRKSPRP